MKPQIIRELGQADILLPALIREALAANDRIKVRMSALQAAAQRAQQPDITATDLAVESCAAGIAPAVLATLIGGARLSGEGRMVAPNLAKLIKDIHEDAVTMIRAITAGTAAEGQAANARLATIDAAGQLKPDAEIEFTQIARLTGVADAAGDSLHRLVMDLHKALNLGGEMLRGGRCRRSRVCFGAERPPLG